MKGEGHPGLGGYMHGYAWSYRLESRHMCLPIAALEFVAVACSFIIFHSLLVAPEGEPAGAQGCWFVSLMP